METRQRKRSQVNDSTVTPRTMIQALVEERGTEEPIQRKKSRIDSTPPTRRSARRRSSRRSDSEMLRKTATLNSLRKEDSKAVKKLTPRTMITGLLSQAPDESMVNAKSSSLSLPLDGSLFHSQVGEEADDSVSANRTNANETFLGHFAERRPTWQEKGLKAGRHAVSDLINRQGAGSSNPVTSESSHHSSPDSLSSEGEASGSQSFLSHYMDVPLTKTMQRSKLKAGRHMLDFSAMRHNVKDISVKTSILEENEEESLNEEHVVTSDPEELHDIMERAKVQSKEMDSSFASEEGAMVDIHKALDTLEESITSTEGEQDGPIKRGVGLKEFIAKGDDQLEKFILGDDGLEESIYEKETQDIRSQNARAASPEVIHTLTIEKSPEIPLIQQSMQQNYTVEYNETFRSLNSVDESHQVEAQITLPPEEKIQEEAEVLEEEEGAGEEEEGGGEEEEGGGEEEGEVEEEEGGGEEGGEGEEEEEKGGEEEGADEENQSSHSPATDKSEVSHVRNAFTELMRNPQVHQTLNEEILERARKNARPHEEPTPTKKTPVLAKSAKKVASRKPRKSNGLSRAQTKSIVEHFSEIRVSKKAIDEIEKISEKFWKRMVEDLNAFAHHAGRKSIHDTDVQLLMTRQRFIKDKNGLHELVRKYLPLEHREQLIPIARSGNIVYPKK